MKLTPSPVLIPVRILLGGRGSARAPPDPPGWMGMAGWSGREAGEACWNISGIHVSKSFSGCCERWIKALIPPHLQASGF